MPMPVSARYHVESHICGGTDLEQATWATEFLWRANSTSTIGATSSCSAIGGECCDVVAKAAWIYTHRDRRLMIPDTASQRVIHRNMVRLLLGADVHCSPRDTRSQSRCRSEHGGAFVKLEGRGVADDPLRPPCSTSLPTLFLAEQKSSWVGRFLLASPARPQNWPVLLTHCSCTANR